MNRAIPYPTLAAQTVANLSPKLLRGPTIPKCEHGVYVPKGEDRAPYCQICSPDGPKIQRAVVLPRSSGAPLSTADRTLANGYSTGCPECGSAIYLRVKETNAAKRECADCGHVYTAKLNAHQRALLVEAEAAYE